MWCTNCGRKLKRRMAFCPYCGRAAAKSAAGNNVQTRNISQSKRKESHSGIAIVIAASITAAFSLIVIIGLVYFWKLSDKQQNAEQPVAEETVNGGVGSGEISSGVSSNEPDAAVQTAVPTAVPTPMPTPVPTPGLDSEIGDIVSFGSYQGESIEWRVLDKSDERLFLISEYLLDAQAFNDAEHPDWDGTWENCSLRTWLNNDFYNIAFSAAEQEKILTTTVTAGTNPQSDIDPGNDTQDKIFILSIDEAEWYFTSDEDRQCAATEYMAQYWVSSPGNVYYWKLRSPGQFIDSGAGVYADGSIDFYGDIAEHGNGTRPAMWIDASE